MKRYEFTLTGTTPLLMHQDSIEHGDALAEWRKDVKNKAISKPGDDRSPGWTWLGALYHDGNHIALPTDNLAVAVRQAGAKIVLKGMKTFKEEAVSGMFFEAEYLPLQVEEKLIPVKKLLDLREENDFTVHLKTVEKMGFNLFMKRAAVGSSKHIRVRPRFDHWTCQGVISVDSEALKIEVLEQLFMLAGRVGVGSWRPGGKTPGRYGMFTASIQPIK